MGKKTSSLPTNNAKEARDLRLKAALKANLQRRKAQTRARAASEDDQITAERGGNTSDKAG